MSDIDSLRLELEAERHNHRKDNEHFMAEIERLRTDYSILKQDYDGQRTELEQLQMALSDLVNRWSTKRGFNSAIQRARYTLGEKP
jgi:predicted  nucleic acid-binding Zn-ribbon protein